MDKNDSVILETQTKESAKKIKAIDKTSVHKICSGQVILTLAVAVKELLENAIDAGASTVEIKLKEYGKDRVEVIDNGSGVEECNLQELTLKHHTSKIEEFSDLLSVTTFGFRGEALSSLCALSNLTVTTRHKSSDLAYKIQYDKNGKITNKQPCARVIGTTVTLEKLFSTLPVRQKEFHKNLKREFNKMCNLLYAYCVISTGVKILCTNTTTKGSRSTIASTQQTNSIKENISSIFGHGQAANILEFIQMEPSLTAIEEHNIKDFQSANMFTIKGFISNCKPGHGRSAQDRQFYYINSRPCEIQKLSKLINSVYHQFNNSQYPFVLLNIEVNTSLVDVNVTPDKRKLFLQNENMLLAIVKTSLLVMFEKHATNFTMNNTQNRGLKRSLEDETKRSFVLKTLLEKRMKISEDKVANLSEVSSDEETEACNSTLEKLQESIVDIDSVKKDIEFQACSSHLDNEERERIVSVKEIKNDLVENDLLAEDEHNISVKNDDKEEIVNETSFQISSSNSISVKTKEKNSSSKLIKIEDENILAEIKTCKSSKIDEFDRQIDVALMDENITSLKLSEASVSVDNRKFLFSLDEVSDISQTKFENDSTEKLEHSPIQNLPDSNINIIETSMPVDNPKFLVSLDEVSDISQIKSEKNSTKKLEHSPIQDLPNSNTENDSDEYECDFTQVPKRDSVKVNVTLDNIRQELLRKKDQLNKSKILTMKFRAEITPLASKNAEKELKREITKDKFLQMEIIGQFNLGFIITKLDSDLFIIDQHASDEKYNFENMERTTILHRQKLVVPQKLELTVANKLLILDHMEVFNKSGFCFNVEETDDGQNIFLTEVPLSKNVCFGKDDIDDLIFMLQNGNEPQTCRPTRIRAMLASRACRKSVMVGSALSKQDMRRLVDHMSEIEHPWNCPHGRPTMRHLVNLDFLNTEDDDVS